MKNKKITLLMVLLFVLSMTMTAMAQEEIKKDGLIASEMILKVQDDQCKTFKLMAEQNSHKKFTGFSIEKIPDPNDKGKFIEEEQKIDESFDEKTSLEGMFDKSEKIEKTYIKTTSFLDPMKTSEEFWDQDVIYTRMDMNDKWKKIVTNPTIMKILRETNKELLHLYATYDKDTVIDGKNYYVININTNNDAKKEIALKIMNKMFNKSLLETNPEINKEEIKKRLLEKFSNTTRNTSTKYYINQETKTLEFMDKTETLTTTIDKINIEITNTTKCKYYDFNQPIIFPVINPEHIQDELNLQ